MTILLILILLGVTLIGAEIFVPGGILGVIGLMSLLGAVVLGFIIKGPKEGGYLAIGLILLTGLSMFIWARYFPKTSFGRHMTLSESGKSFKADHPELAELLGKDGTAQTDLRPGGIAKIGTRRVDVLAEGTLVSAGTVVTVIKVAGNRVIVRPKPLETT